jgi:hypothetical protein
MSSSTDPKAKAVFAKFRYYNTLDRRARAALVRDMRKLVADIDPSIEHTPEQALLVLYADVVEVRHGVKIWRNQ